MGVGARVLGRPWTTWLPLCIVLGVAIVKEAIEDYKRYKQDVEVNARAVKVRGASAAAVHGHAAWQDRSDRRGSCSNVWDPRPALGSRWRGQRWAAGAGASAGQRVAGPALGSRPLPRPRRRPACPPHAADGAHAAGPPLPPPHNRSWTLPPRRL